MKRPTPVDVGGLPLDEPAMEPGVGKSWPMYAVRNAFGHLADVTPHKMFAQSARARREDAQSCDLVEVDVIVKRALPEPVVVKKRGKA